MGKRNSKESHWKKIRSWVNDIHLWLGLASGIILFVVCLTGTIYTFSAEIKEFLAPETYSVEVPENGNILEAEKLINIVKKENEGQAATLVIPANPEKAYQVIMKKEGERRGTAYYIDQYSGELKGDGKNTTSEFFTSMFKLHRWLLLDMNIGRPIVGVATIIFVLILISGMVIWFPNKVKHWRQGLKIKTKSSFKRLNHDLHNALGFYAFLLMLVMALTGLTWSFEWYKDGLSNVLGAKVFSREKLEIKSSPDEKSEAISIEHILKIADQALPYPGDYRINLAQNSEDVVSISKNKVGFFASSGTDKLIIDQYSAEILQEDIFAEKAFNEKVAASIKPLHMGYVYGTFSKILYFISCLIATSLPVTGTIIWANKLKKKSKRSKNKAKEKVAFAKI